MTTKCKIFKICCGLLITTFGTIMFVLCLFLMVHNAVITGYQFTDFCVMLIALIFIILGGKITMDAIFTQALPENWRTNIDREP